MNDDNISSINYSDLTEEIFIKVETTSLNSLECNNSLNSTQYDIQNTTDFPPSLKFNVNATKDIVVYSVLFFIAAVGNLTVFITLFRSRYWKSRVNLMIMHLAAADLMVTFLLIPLEIGWRITTQWLAGNSACKVFQFLRAFCLYLSSMVLVCISLDRYFAILFPLKVNDAQRRGKLMLGFAWTTAAACSLPQSIIFHVDSHPEYPSFKQCVTFGFFMSQSDEMTYNLFCLSVMYFLPLVLIVAVYVRILFEISQKSKESKDFFKSIEEQRKLDASSSSKQSSRLRLRRSDMTSIERARTKSLKMTVIIVLAFIWCWTPYVVMVMWYMFDRASAEKVDSRLQDVLFIMAVSNSCVNPLVYGTYNLNLKNELWRCLGRQTDQPLSRRPTASTSFRGRGSIAYQPSVSSYNSPNLKTFDEADYSRQGENHFTRRKQTSFYRGLIQDEKESSPFHFRQGNSFMSKKIPDVGIPGNAFGHNAVEVQFIELPIIEIHNKIHKSTTKNESISPIESDHSMEHLKIPLCHTFACDEGPDIILESELNNLQI